MNLAKLWTQPATRTAPIANHCPAPSHRPDGARRAVTIPPPPGGNGECVVAGGGIRILTSNNNPQINMQTNENNAVEPARAIGQPRCTRSTLSSPSVLPARHREACRDLVNSKLIEATALLAECRKRVVSDKTQAKAEVGVYRERNEVCSQIVENNNAVKIDAQAKLGEELLVMAKNTGTAGKIVGPGRGHRNGATRREALFTPAPPTLASLGISHKESAKAQFLAELKKADLAKFMAVRDGEVPLSAARHEFISNRHKAKLDAIASQGSADPEGLFQVIVADPPWEYENRSGPDCHPTEPKGFKYPTMPLAEIKQLDIVARFADKDCWVFLWTTEKYQRDAFDVMEAWGAKRRFTMVWHKDGGMQTCNNPQFNCEFILVGAIGNPRFVDTKDFSVCFDAPRGKHSEKPEKFYEILRRVTAGRRLDVFNRRKIDGFVGYGYEAPK